MRGILTAVEQRLATTEGRLTLWRTPLAHHVLTSKLSPADIRVISTTLETKLLRLGIQSREFPRRDPRFTSDEVALEKILADPVRQDVVIPRVRHDVDAVAAVLTLRQGRPSTSINRSVAVFCTASGRVVRNVQRWFTEQGGQGHPPVVHQIALTNIAWLKKPALVPDLKMHELVVLCRAVLRPSRETWDKFIGVLRDLRADGTITDDETAAIVASELTEPLLARLDDEFEPDANSITEAIERVGDEYRQAAWAGAEEPIRRVKEDASIVEQTASAAVARAETIEARLEVWVGRISRLAAQLAFVFGVLLAVVSGVLSWPDLLNGITGTVKWVARVVFVVMAILGVCSTAYGINLADIRTWISNQVSNRLRRYFAGQNRLRLQQCCHIEVSSAHALWTVGLLSRHRRRCAYWLSEQPRGANRHRRCRGRRFTHWSDRARLHEAGGSRAIDGQGPAVPINSEHQVLAEADLRVDTGTPSWAWFRRMRGLCSDLRGYTFTAYERSESQKSFRAGREARGLPFPMCQCQRGR